MTTIENGFEQKDTNIDDRKSRIADVISFVTDRFFNTGVSYPSAKDTSQLGVSGYNVTPNVGSKPSQELPLKP